MSYRTTIVGAGFSEIISAFDVDGLSRLTGEAQADFSAVFYKDGSVEAVTWDIIEVGASGEYYLTVPSGFPSTGHWVVSVTILATDDIWRTDVEVTSADGSQVGVVTGSPF